jgi:hypothetical protein
MNRTPNVKDVVKSWSVQMSAQFVKKTIKDRVLTETRQNIKFRGVPLQPLRSQELRLRSEGERAWRYFALYCDFNFNIDDIIIMNKTPYRITKKDDWSCCGYCKYELTEDYERNE